MTATAKIDGEWARCKKCGGKLGRIVRNMQDKNSCFILEIKCHSCKTINNIIGCQKAPENENKEERNG